MATQAAKAAPVRPQPTVLGRDLDTLVSPMSAMQIQVDAGGRAYAPTRRLVNGNAEMEFPGFEVKPGRSGVAALRGGAQDAMRGRA